MPAHRDFFKNFPGNIWIETGTYLGDGIQSALNCGYDKIFSIELSKNLAEDATNRFRTNELVQVIEGRAHTKLPEILKNFSNEKIIFWLDAHYSACGTAGEDDPNPLMKELSAIENWKKQKKAKTPIILIDDMRTFSYSQSGFSLKEIFDSLKRIDENYLFEFADGYQEHTGNIFQKDILVARLQQD
jgi:hypothetical protein